MRMHVSAVASRGGYLLVIFLLAFFANSAEGGNVSEGLARPFWLNVISQQSSYGPVIYFALPVWISVVAFMVPRDRAELMVIRTGSNSRLFIRWMCRFALPNVFAISMTLFVAAVVASVGLSVEGYGNPIPQFPETTLWWWHSEQWFVVALAAMHTAALFMVYACVIFVSSYRKPLFVAVAVGMILYIGTLALLRSPHIHNFGMTYQSSSGANATPEGVIARLCVFMLISLAIAGIWHGWEHRIWKHSSFVTRTILIGAGVFLLSGYPLSQRRDVVQLFQSLFSSGTPERLSLLGMIFYSAVFLAGGAWIALKEMRGSEALIPYIAIRSGNLSRWFGLIVLRLLRSSAALLLTVFSVLVVSALLSGSAFPTSGKGFIIINLYLLGVCQLVIIGMLNVVLVLAQFPGPVVVAVWASFLVLSHPFFVQYGFAPFGLSMISGLGEADMWFRVAIALLWALAVMGCVYMALRTKKGQMLLISRNGA